MESHLELTIPTIIEPSMESKETEEDPEELIKEELNIHQDQLKVQHLKVHLNGEQLNSHQEEKDNESDRSVSLYQNEKATPLAVPMVANTNQQSVTRNDAKIITQCRLKRLKELSCRPEEHLSKDQKDEKKRIIRLEKNRRAAAMSRRKKKMYVKNLEQRAELMAKHLAILEMENNHLRAMLASQPQTQNQHPMFNPHFDPSLNNNNNNSNKESIDSSATQSITPSHSIEPMSNNPNEPAFKKRKLNGQNQNNPNSVNSNNMNGVMRVPMQMPVGPPPMQKFMGYPPRLPHGMSFPHGMAGMHHPHGMPPPLAPIPPMPMPPMPHNNNLSSDNEENETIDSKNIEFADTKNNQFPPSVFVPPTITNEYINSLSEDDFEMSESVQECGSVEGGFETREFWNFPEKCPDIMQ